MGSKRINTEEFVYRSRLKFEDKYIFDKTVYINSATKVKIDCPKHGTFETLPNDFLAGKGGCGRCRGFYRSVPEYVEQFRAVHGERYDYGEIPLDIQLASRTMIPVRCDKHGVFQTQVNRHISNRAGCPACGNEAKGFAATGRGRKTQTQFIADAQRVHGERYDYTNLIYLGSSQKVEIVCNTHGPHWVMPHHHLEGHGCPSCRVSSTSAETAWLDSLCVPVRQYRLKLGRTKPFLADGYDPRTNTVYEFYGDFWHGNPARYERDAINRITGLTFGHMYDKTMEKEALLRSYGFNIVAIWESEWKDRQR